MVYELKKIEDINLSSIKYIYEHQSLKSETWYVIRVLQDENKTIHSKPTKVCFLFMVIVYFGYNLFRSLH